eukprot:CAMPEP_0197598188 /NCGR_PEP_ID=MMETSP1326-20131121/28824_1 /TAXON_ID=1155430 /ORGANISM="Genus nov. species nov., Strain RCC2288" /LENGTH=184 /DNA_ID=CAMNT_0043164961 /DNA_START=32 /DNA_END=589 /DNA_ORIENTATION=+
MSFSVTATHNVAAFRAAAASAAPSKASARRGGSVCKAQGESKAGGEVVKLAHGRQGRRALLGASVGLFASRAAAAWADDYDDVKKDYSNYRSGAVAEEGAPKSDLVKRLLAKSAENKEVNDKDRMNYDTQYAANIAILKGTGYVPKDAATRERLGVTRPAECGLPYFNASPTCLKFDELDKESK